MYCRVSTKEQAEEGNSLVTQEKICREYATRGGFVISKIFIEEGESAKTQNRPELQTMLEYCSVKKNQISTVIVYKIDRLSRNMDDYSDIRIRLKDYGVVIRSTSEQFDSNPAGRFMENILANVAQFDNDVRTERSVNGMKEAVRSGRYIWMAPYGYTNGIVEGKPNIIPNPELVPLIKKAFYLVIKSEPVDRIWSTLRTEGLTLSRSAFYRLIRNKLYCGLIERFGEINKGGFEPIITERTFETAAAILKNIRPSIIPYTTANPDFPLRRFITHPDGLKLTGGWSKSKSGRKFAYYRYNLKHHNFPKEFLEIEFCKFLNSFAVKSKHLLRLREFIKEKYETSQTTNRNIEADALDKIEILKKRQSDILNKNLKGFISDSVLQTESSRVEDEILQIKRDMELSPQSLTTSIPELFAAVEDILINPGLFWQRASFDLKSRFQVFKFPQGVCFDGEKFRTPEVCRIYKAKSDFFDEKSCVVRHPNRKLNTPLKVNLPPSITACEEYLKELVRLKDEVVEATTPFKNPF